MIISFDLLSEPGVFCVKFILISIVIFMSSFNPENAVLTLIASLLVFVIRPFKFYQWIIVQLLMLSVTAIECLPLIVCMLVVIFCIQSRSLIIRRLMMNFLSSSLLVDIVIIKLRKESFILSCLCVMFSYFNCVYVYKISSRQSERSDFSFTQEVDYCYGDYFLGQISLNIVQ